MSTNILLCGFVSSDAATQFVSFSDPFLGFFKEKNKNSNFAVPVPLILRFYFFFVLQISRVGPFSSVTQWKSARLPLRGCQKGDSFQVNASGCWFNSSLSYFFAILTF